MDREEFPFLGRCARKGQDKVNQTDQAQPESKRRVSRLAVFIIVVILIVAGFGAGALLVNVQFRAAQEAWKQEKAGLDSKLAAQTAELSAVNSRELLWKLNEGMSTVYIDVSEKNFGLARDEMDAMSGFLAKASADLDAATKSQLAPLPPLMEEIARNVAALSPEARSKAREAMGLLRKMIDRKSVV
jgi:hypothetical protein